MKSFAKILFAITFYFALTGCGSTKFLQKSDDITQQKNNLIILCNKRVMISPCLNLYEEEKRHVSPVYSFHYCAGKEQISLYDCDINWGDCDGESSNGCESKVKKKDEYIVKVLH